jgi:hypothetical protein
VRAKALSVSNPATARIPKLARNICPARLHRHPRLGLEFPGKRILRSESADGAAAVGVEGAGAMGEAKDGTGLRSHAWQLQ